MSQFLMIRGADMLHVGLDWSGFQLESGTASSDGRTRLVAGDDATVTLTFPPQILSESAITPFSTIPLEAHRSRVSLVQFAVPAGTAIELNPESVLAALCAPGAQMRSSGAGDNTTVLEIPWHLLITVDPRSLDKTVVSDHATLPVTSAANTTGLWRARLRASDGDDADARLSLEPIKVVEFEGVQTPLTDAERQQIFKEVDQFKGLPQLRRLELSALGGSLSVTAKWPDFEWDHEIVMGRDQHIRVEEKGSLYPFGHRAVFTTITDRSFSGDPTIAALISSTTLTITEPLYVVSWRNFPFGQVEILGRSFAIDAPPSGHSFIPKVNGAPLMFGVRCAAANGDISLLTPLVFVDDSGTLEECREAWKPFNPIPLPGIPIDLVRSQPPSDSDVHEVHAIALDTVPDADIFLPIVSAFTVALPALRALMANAASDVGQVNLIYSTGDDPDVALEVAGGVQIDFTDRPDRSGGLMAPKFLAKGISRTQGLVPFSPGESLSDIYAGATLLGLPLGELLALPDAPVIVPLTDPPGAKMTWENLVLQNFGPLKTTAATKATLTVERSAEKSEIKCCVEQFELLVPPPADKALVTLTFGALTFTQSGGHAPDLTVDGLKIVFGNELALLQTLLCVLLPLLGAAARSGRSPAPDRTSADPATGSPGLTIHTDPTGLTATFAAGIDQVPAGIFLMRNIAAHFGVFIPFSSAPITVSLGFASRDNPFSLSVLTFGGGGYIDATLGGLTLLEASMDFGAVIAVDFIVASAEVHALGGVHFLQNDKTVTFEAFIRLGGCVEVLGVVSVSVDLLVALAYQPPDLVGHATLVIEVDLTLFSQSVTIDSGYWRLTGSSSAFSPFRRASLDDGLANLLEYYEAFSQ
jgi:hypothetical protein